MLRFDTRELRRLLADDRGSSTTEYAVVMGLIVVGTIAIIIQIGPKLIGRWTSIGNSLDGATGPSVVVTDAQRSSSTTLP